MVEKKKRKSNVEGRKKLLKFSEGRERIWLFKKNDFFFQKAMSDVLF